MSLRMQGLGSDLVAGGAVILMVLMMVIPLPPMLLSLLIACNLAASICVLLLSMYTQQPLDFSAFPSLLLLTTLFRLSLNVSTTRLILLQGNAGSVVQAFGQFVVGGNPLVGFIVFLILVIIQFIVITRGAERVAEVAARFTLDALPGKQMAIDAELNAGLIDEKKARQRRDQIEGEADFYGAMDGASKFVKGDAVAALLIIAINIVAGFLIGMLQRHLSAQDSLSQYTLLTVGDGLSAQIPALLVSTATGIIVTRAAAQDNLGRELSSELLAQPRVLLGAGGALALLALVPGIPKLTFFGLSAGLFLMARTASRRMEAGSVGGGAVAAPGGGGTRGGADTEPAPLAGRTPAETMGLLEVDPLEIELGYGLLKLAEGPGGGELMNRIALCRKQIAMEMGIVLPLVRVRDNVQLAPHAYAIRLRGSEIARGELRLDGYLAMDAGAAAHEGLSGTPTREPAFGLPAIWIGAADRSRAELAGYTVVDPATVLATHFSELCKRHAAEILSREECKALLDVVRQRQPSLVDELVPGVLATGQILRVLQNLLREGVSIRNLTLILEALSDGAVQTKEPEALTEKVRAALGREITRDLGAPKLAVLTLDPELEARLTEAAAGTPGSALDGGALRNLKHSLQEGTTVLGARGRPAAVLTTPAARPIFRRLVERTFPQVRVVSTAELVGDVEVESVGRVTA